jgi:hypothetical protein
MRLSGWNRRGHVETGNVPGRQQVGPEVCLEEKSALKIRRTNSALSLKAKRPDMEEASHHFLETAKRALTRAEPWGSTVAIAGLHLRSTKHA